VIGVNSFAAVQVKLDVFVLILLNREPSPPKPKVMVATSPKARVALLMVGVPTLCTAKSEILILAPDPPLHATSDGVPAPVAVLSKLRLRLTGLGIN
jgi:hypothetical protein